MSVAGGWTVLDIGVSDSYLGDGRRGDTEIARPAGGDELDDPGAVDLGGGPVRRNPPQVERGDAVGDLEDVDHVVGDEYDRVTGVAHPADQVEHLAGLADTEGGRRPVLEGPLG